MICTLANSLWLGGCLNEFGRFHDAVKRVAQEQHAILQCLLAENADTEFGRLHGFSSIRSAREYQRRVPLRDYEGYQELIERIGQGAPSVLTREPVRMFERTSGSAAASKLIPYTASLQAEFQRAIRAWIGDLFLHRRELLRGQAYWSVSPATIAGSRTVGGIPIGFEDDASYLGGWQQRLVQSVMAVPGAVRRISDMETFRYLTLLFLVGSRNLRLVSVWNPTFLSLLVERLREWGGELVRDLEQGGISRTASLPDDLRSRLRPRRRRASELRAALGCSSAAELHAQLWPELRLISCWADANAAAPATQLSAVFPQARIQAKGLIATEGFISFPLTECQDTGAALAVRSHFLEFLPVDSAGQAEPGRPRLAHELDQGQRYAVVLTTGGGLYRYQIHDLVEVTGHFHGCPLVRFLERQGYVSDWVGEKLNEAHVSRVLQEVWALRGISPSFAMLACDTRPPDAGYILYIDTPEPDELLDQAATEIEAGLRQNFHYNYARELGQLSVLRVFRARNAAAAYLAEAVRNGLRAGNVKPPALDRGDGWSRVFQGELVVPKYLARPA